jgi:hypothetical protein
MHAARFSRATEKEKRVDVNRCTHARYGLRIHECGGTDVESSHGRRPATILCAALAGSALLCACAGSGAGLDQSGRPAANGGSSGPLVADFTSIQQHVFSPICTVCHAGATAPKGLRLDETNSYALLVGVPSTEVPSLQRVHAGDPDNSYIVQKIEGHAAVGARMPLGGPYLDAATIAVIRQWITDGALRNAQGAVPAALALSAVPGLDEVLPEPPARAVLGLAADIDATQLYSITLEVQSLDAEGAAATLATLHPDIPTGNPRALMFDLPHAMPPGQYRLLLRAPGGRLPTVAGSLPLGGDASGTVVSVFTVGGAQ